jgi:hypothetical protein
MSMDKKLWYKMLGKEDAFDRSLFYKINEISDPTEYILDLGKNNSFKFDKKTKVALFTKGNKSLIYDLAELKKIFDFAKKNGAV